MELKDNIADYTYEELLELDGNDLLFELALQRAAAVKGLKLPGPEPKEPEEKLPPEDMKLYQAYGVAFLDENDAKKVIDLVNSLNSRVLRKISYVHSTALYSYKTRLNSYEIEQAPLVLPVYSPELFDSLESTSEFICRRLKEWEDEHKEWTSRKNAMRELRSEFYNLIAEARSRKNQEDLCLRRFKTYLEIAEGNVEEAWKFFTVTEEDIPEGYDPREHLEEQNQ